jgi:hypothetical protein
MIRARALAAFASLLLLASLASCGGTQPAATLGDDDDARTGPPEGWPRILVVTPGAGPALYLGSDDDSPAIGYVSGGVRVRLDGPPRNGRVPVTVSGGLSARGWMPLSRVGMYVTRRGRVDGTPTYVGVGDLVSLVGRNDDGSWRVSIAPWLGRGENDRLGPFEGTLDADQLSESPAEGPDTGLNPGENHLLPAGREVPVYDRANGRVIATIPAADTAHTVVVLRTRRGWNGIRAGVGPYLIGYVQGELEAAEGPPTITYEPRARVEGQPPQRIQEEQGTLYTVRSGARIRFLDRVIARTRGDGYARELGRVGEGQVDAYVAVDDSCAIRGLVRSRDLQRVPGQPEEEEEEEEEEDDEEADEEDDDDDRGRGRSRSRGRSDSSDEFDDEEEEEDDRGSRGRRSRSRDRDEEEDDDDE